MQYDKLPEKLKVAIAAYARHIVSRWDVDNEQRIMLPLIYHQGRITRLPGMFTKDGNTKYAIFSDRGHDSPQDLEQTSAWGKISNS